jgi:vacuolar-type H+-ATPase subunit F/Vma7
MKIVALGRAEEIRGFALAGVATVVCQTAQDADEIVTRLGSREADAGLLIVARWVGQAAGPAIARMRATQAPPIVLVLDERVAASGQP